MGQSPEGGLYCIMDPNLKDFLGVCVCVSIVDTFVYSV